MKLSNTYNFIDFLLAFIFIVATISIVFLVGWVIGHLIILIPGIA